VIRQKSAPMTEDVGRASHRSEARKMLTEKQVLAKIPIARSTLWRMEKAGKFPKGIHFLGRRKLFYEDEISAWQVAIEGQCRRRP